MKLEPKSPQQQMDEARINYYRCVAGSHTLFWICAACYGIYRTATWIFN